MKKNWTSCNHVNYKLFQQRNTLFTSGYFSMMLKIIPRILPRKEFKKKKSITFVGFWKHIWSKINRTTKPHLLYIIPLHKKYKDNVKPHSRFLYDTFAIRFRLDVIKNLLIKTYSQYPNNIIMILFILSESRPPTVIKIKSKPVLERELSFMFSKIVTQALLVSNKWQLWPNFSAFVLWKLYP